ncbi:hypothetical protein PtA15_6A414 [Puccinia triticina]|uniref:Uncharacterized protein n=1 Tax=Puccinia triticina TaxID=208348 RepID=A0ABY7CM53_9BASI|nr:uncharacterized protein PtA15_6A414 [Puccinia triticina]WAQ85785.1 hypothetical protein PtA15_6A414 [Puccinia triticina]WAR55663.1 hypothetical protein PtB15_6B406 [Puccinia triticina]
MVLHHHFSLTLATPPLIAEAGLSRIEEPSRLEDDVFEDLETLQLRPAKRMTLADQELHHGFLNPQSTHFFQHAIADFHAPEQFLFAHDRISKGWVEPATSDPLKVNTGSIGSPSGENVNPMISNHPHEYEVYLGPFGRVASKNGRSNSRLGKHSRAEPTGEVYTPLKVAKKFTWHTLAELYDDPQNINNLHLLALTRIKTEDNEDTEITKTYNQLIETEWKNINHLESTRPEAHLKEIRIMIFKIRNSAAKDGYEYQMRPVKNEMIVIKRDLRCRAARIINALIRYHNLELRIGGHYLAELK